jgi:TonB family protein
MTRWQDSGFGQIGLMRGLNAIFVLCGTLVLLSPGSARGAGDISDAEISRPSPAGASSTICTDYYPTEAKQASVEGTAQVAFIVETDGSVSDVHVSKSSGTSLLDWASIACAQHLHYIPAKRAGVPVRVEWSTTILYAQSMVSVRDNYVDTSRPSADGPPHICLNFYPVEAMRSGVHGTVSVAFTVEVDGSVGDIRISQSSGNQSLDSATIACVQHWRYHPAIRAGAPVAAEWASTVQFALK